MPLNSYSSAYGSCGPSVAEVQVTSVNLLNTPKAEACSSAARSMHTRSSVAVSFAVDDDDDEGEEEAEVLSTIATSSALLALHFASSEVPYLVCTSGRWWVVLWLVADYGWISWFILQYDYAHYTTIQFTVTVYVCNSITVTLFLKSSPDSKARAINTKFKHSTIQKIR